MHYPKEYVVEICCMYEGKHIHIFSNGKNTVEMLQNATKRLIDTGIVKLKPNIVINYHKILETNFEMCLN